MGKKLIVLCVVIAAILVHKYASVREGKVVVTKSGSVKGIISESRNGREYFEWLGIPYAKPPVGNLRFASPEPIEKWDGTRDGSRYGATCAQIEVFFSNWKMGEEDCLFLNIHVPKVETGHDLLPVLMFIHGGGFTSLSPQFLGASYFMDENVVLVTFNYRLGVFGFLNTGDESIRGNMGLKDQVLAMKWIKQNIQYFGGDPNKITISGQSAGGASVHYHLVSPMTTGLFQRAISQSGVSFSLWSYHTTTVAKKLALEFVRGVNCPIARSSERINCLRKKTTEELLSGSLSSLTSIGILYPHSKAFQEWFQPSREAVNDTDAYLVENPLKIVEQGRAKRIPWIIGFTSEEGMVTASSFMRDPARISLYESNWEENILRALGNYRLADSSSKLADRVRQFYFPPDASLDTEQKLEQYAKMFGDLAFNFPIRSIAEAQRKFSPTYMYQLSRRGGWSFYYSFGFGIDISFLPRLLLDTTHIIISKAFYGIDPITRGVCHADDLWYLFPIFRLFDYLPRTVADNEFSKDMVRLWARFAQHGPLEFRGVELSPLNASGPLTYLDMNEIPAIFDDPFKDRMEFGKSILEPITNEE